jgi:hypothetical protein
VEHEARGPRGERGQLGRREERKDQETLRAVVEVSNTLVIKMCRSILH